MNDLMRCMTKYHKGWGRMWGVLGTKFGDSSCYNPGSGEVWRYVGTINDSHKFLHSDLPGHYAHFGGMDPGRTITYVSVDPDDFQLPGEHVQAAMDPSLPPPNNYTCTRCGNKKLNTFNDRSCWSCGERVVQ